MKCVVGNEDLDEKRDGPLVCFRCSNRILRHLRELEEYLPTLSAEKTVGGDTGRKTGFESTSPANDAVLMHQDPRSGTEVITRHDGTLIAEHGAFGVVVSWAAMVREERDLAPPKRATLATEAGCLRSSHSWIVEQPWVDDYAAELKSVHAAVRALAHDPVPRPVGKCIRFEGKDECRGDVFELDDASGARCSKDKRHIYTGLDMVRLRAAWEVA